jgi:hypothetical protein
MKSVNLIVELDNRVRDVEFYRLEDVEIEPSVDEESFHLDEGRWIAIHSDFKIEDDDDLDITIIVTGNPGTSCELTVKIDNEEPRKFQPFKPFSSNGRAIFSEEIAI